MFNKFLLLLFISSIAFSQGMNKANLSGSLKNDTYFLHLAGKDKKKFDSDIYQQKKRIPILAASYSFLLPGAGQVYNEDYIKAGAFVAAEVAAAVLTVVYTGKGDNQTDVFENYANEHWSVYRYAKWTLNNLKQLNPDLLNDQSRVEYYREHLFDGENVNWNVLNELEEEVSRSPSGQYYSHRLAPYGDQQYYEMIGKYSQFNVGWEEFGDETQPYHYYEGDGVVEQFKYYSGLRGKANDYYNVARWAVIAIVTNHFISALEAAWSASRFNKRYEVNVSVAKETLGFYTEYYPKLNLKVRL